MNLLLLKHLLIFLLQSPRNIKEAIHNCDLDPSQVKFNQFVNPYSLSRHPVEKGQNICDDDVLYNGGWGGV